MEMTESYTNRTFNATYGKVCASCIISYCVEAARSIIADKYVPHQPKYLKIKLVSVVKSLLINRLCMENDDFNL